ncbi:MAG TPA: thiamine phosphate synthase [Lachnospiraceae bacterium]|nr:thiamine phosphate synthase [Lachnospiraceae bacterium]
MSTQTLEEAVEEAIKGGATLMQLREKNCSSKEFYETAVSVKKITEKYNIPLIINDRVDIALAVDAEGVHVGQSDLPAKVVRKILGKDKIIGVSARNSELAVKAYEDGADYLGVGAMYATSTKKDAKVITMEELVKIRNSVPIPIVVIGGVNENNISDFKGTGIDGVAVVSAIISKPDIEEAARNLKQLVGAIK